MKAAEYPQRKCRAPVEGNAGQSHPCELADLHAGPDASFSVPGSVKRRDAWEADHPGWEKLSLFSDPFEEIKP